MEALVEADRVVALREELEDYEYFLAHLPARVIARRLQRTRDEIKRIQEEIG